MSITSNDDVIDSRDVIDRIHELVNDPDADQDELDLLRQLAAQGSLIENWEYGATLIRDSYFEDYAKELFEETAGIADRNAMERWPFTHIDWVAAADELMDDYTAVEFDGVTYYAR